MSKEGKAKRSDPDGGSEKNKRRKVGSDADAKACNADECINLHLVSTAAELQGDGDSDFTFPPEFPEQYFGEEGKIYGYKGLKIDVWLHAVSFNAHAEINYKAKLRDAGPGKPTTDVHSKIKEIFGDGLIEKRDVFSESFASYTNSFLQLLQEQGEVMTSWRFVSEEKPRTMEAASASLSQEASGKLGQIVRLELRDFRVREWYARLTPLVLLFIEGGRPIESDDPLWEMYVSLEGEGPETVVTGFCTVYRFYHYPDSTRLRVSQILVLPPYQGKGYGFRLLETVNRIAVDRDCYDVTMEDPSESLQELRDCMDVFRLLSFPPIVMAIDCALAKISRLAKHPVGDVVENLSASAELCESRAISNSANGKGNKSLGQLESGSNGMLLPPPSLVEDVRKGLKISKMQLKRCWESLLFLRLETSEVVVQDIFRGLLVKRLHSEILPSQKKM